MNEPGTPPGLTKRCRSSADPCPWSGQVDLDGSIDAGRQAVSASPNLDEADAARLSNLSGALRTRFDRTGQMDDLNEAIDQAQRAVATVPTDHPDRIYCLIMLAAALATRLN